MAKQLAVVEVVDSTIHQRQAAGNTFRYQDAFLQASEGERMLVQVSIDRDQAGYAAGKYFIGGGSFERDAYGRIVMKKYGLELIPVPSAGKASA
jgi:hypothetical protein